MGIKISDLLMMRDIDVQNHIINNLPLDMRSTVEQILDNFFEKTSKKWFYTRLPLLVSDKQQIEGLKKILKSEIQPLSSYPQLQNNMGRIRIKDLLMLRDRSIINTILCNLPEHLRSPVKKVLNNSFEKAPKYWMDNLLPILADKQQIKELKKILESKI